MRAGWKRVAECGDNHAYAPEEIRTAIIPALEQDCRVEITQQFVHALYKMFQEQEITLFKDQLGAQLEALRRIAGHGLGRVALEHAILISAQGETGLDALVKAIANALRDRAARGARQIEEHYCRQSTSPRAQQVRTRIEEAIGGTDVQGLARQILKLDPRPSTPVARKQQGLDDGVRL
jgi:hypothetical protein